MNSKFRCFLFVTVLLSSFILISIDAKAASPEENYKWYCAQCHGLKGSGDGINATSEMPVSPRNHTDPVEMAKLSDDDIYFATKDGGKSVGKSALMPPWGDTLSDPEIKEMVQYLRKLCNCTYQK
jgi:mono/diheme cytochrome c family protein